ncbi:MAG TPA: hypothetical protein VFV38_05040 [Ktedonobacteraceae bacterium]|nr:hypothetical protein [Ktedonobacteraceae bacterium]
MRRFASFFILLLVIIALPVPLIVHDWVLFFTLLGVVAAQLFALFLNKRNYLMQAGIVSVCASDLGLAIAVLSVGKLTPYSLPLFDLMVQPECVAVSLLPPKSVFLVAMLHCCFFAAVVLFLPHTPAFDQILGTQGYDALLRPMITQLIVAIVTYLWVRSHQKTRGRLMRAKAIASAEASLSALNAEASGSAVEKAAMSVTYHAVCQMVQELQQQNALGSAWTTPTGTPVDQIAQWIVQHQTRQLEPEAMEESHG